MINLFGWGWGWYNLSFWGGGLGVWYLEFVFFLSGLVCVVWVCWWYLSCMVSFFRVDVFISPLSFFVGFWFFFVGWGAVAFYSSCFLKR